MQHEQYIAPKCDTLDICVELGFNGPNYGTGGGIGSGSLGNGSISNFTEGESL